MKMLVHLGVVSTLALAVAFHSACGDDGNPRRSSSALADEQAEAPTAGLFLSGDTDCLDGTATLESFVANPDLATIVTALVTLIGLGEHDVPVIAEVLTTGDPSRLPVPAGFEQDALLPTSYDEIPGDDAVAMLPSGGLPLDTPVLGQLPVVCDDDLVADPGSATFDDLPEPTHAVAMMPVYDDSGDLQGLLLAVVGDAESGQPPDVNAVTLPDDDALPTLPDDPATIIGTLVGLVE